jgi:hypothetical protein
VVIPYFGAWPEWIDLFFESARRNASIDFLVITDCDASQFAAPNILVRSTSFEDYLQMVRNRLRLPFDPADSYKLCDLRPMYGALHESDLASYDFYGWCDVDVLFGDLRSFYTDEILAGHDVLSTHADRISGHLALFRNTERNRHMYRRIYEWRTGLLRPGYGGLDEFGLTHAYLMTAFDKANEKFGWRLDNALTRALARRRRRGMYLVEQYTTPFVSAPWIDGSRDSAQPSEWFYRDGHITNSRDDREFIYLHMMSFKSSRWRHDGTPAPWEGKPRICWATAADMSTGIRISNAGIEPLG